MIGRRFMLVVLIGLASGMILESSVSAGIFSRKPKPSSQRANELVTILKTDPSESNRAAAAEELAAYDMKTYPEIVPPLLQALNDPAVEVRLQSVQTLGKLRPVSQEIGMALEQTHASDSSMKVRMQARSTLWSYHLAGYRSAKPPQPTGPMLPNQQPGPTVPNQQSGPMMPNQKPGPMIITTQEPPLADRVSVPPPPAPPSSPPMSAPVRLVPAPVLQPAQPLMLQPPAPTVSRPMPSAPSSPAMSPIPTQPPVVVSPPIQDLGPAVNAPK